MRFLWSVFIACIIAACASGPGGGGGSPVGAVHLFGLPVTLNLDGVPGADGFAVRVYMTRGAEAKGSAVRAGWLEVLMYDGVVSNEILRATVPNQSWKFPGNDLPRYEEVTSLGHGYRFALRWTQPPKRAHITVVARYINEKGEPIYSSASTISSVVR